jgi:hypothetical protein
MASSGDCSEGGRGEALRGGMENAYNQGEIGEKRGLMRWLRKKFLVGQGFLLLHGD